HRLCRSGTGNPAGLRVDCERAADRRVRVLAAGRRQPLPCGAATLAAADCGSVSGIGSDDARRARDRSAGTGRHPAAAARRGGHAVRGAYGLVRHPLYLGWILMVFGTPHLTGDRLLFAAVTSAYLLVAIPWEERSLEVAFGDAYRQYKQRVRWRVLPYVY